MIRPGLLIPSLAAAALFFGWQTYEAWTRPVSAVGAPAPGGAPAVPIGVAPADAPATVDLSSPVASIVARPVFRPDRRPFREDQAALVPTRNYDAELARLTLLGVLLLGNDKKGVVVGKGGAGRDERWEVSPGDNLSGFTVKDVGAEGLTLAADDREFLLPLYAGGPKGQPGQAPIRTDTSPPIRQAAPSQQPPAARAGAGTTRVMPGAAAPVPAAASPPAAVAPAAPATPAPRPRDFGRDRTRTRPVYTPGRR